MGSKVSSMEEAAANIRIEITIRINTTLTVESWTECKKHLSLKCGVAIVKTTLTLGVSRTRWISTTKSS